MRLMYDKDSSVANRRRFRADPSDLMKGLGGAAERGTWRLGSEPHQPSKSSAVVYIECFEVNTNYLVSPATPPTLPTMFLQCLFLIYQTYYLCGSAELNIAFRKTSSIP